MDASKCHLPHFLNLLRVSLHFAAELFHIMTTINRRTRPRRVDRWILYIVIIYAFALTLVFMRNASPRPPPPPPRVIYRRDYTSSRPTTFLVGIFTVMEDVQRRRLIRETMLGREMQEQERLCSLQQYLSPSVTSKCQVIYTFVVGGNPQAPTQWLESNYLPRTIDASQMLKHEKDILYLNIKENMNEGKTTSWFDYAASLEDSGIDYISKADSDALISIPQLLSYINGHLLPATQRPKVYGGFLNEYQACGGAGELCDKIRGKVYMSGQFYWLSRDLAVYLSQIAINDSSKSSRKFITTKNEDSDLGIRVLSYPEPLSLAACNGAQFWIHPLKTEQSWLDEYHKLVGNEWQVTDSSNWMGGLHEAAAEQDLVQSILGRIRETDTVPIILD